MIKNKKTISILLFTMVLMIMLTALYGTNDYMPNRVIIKLTDTARGNQDFNLQNNPLSTGLPNLDALNTNYGADVMLPVFRGALNLEEKEALGMMNWYFIDMTSEIDSTIITSYHNDTNIEKISLDFYVTSAEIPNDEYFDQNWGHNNMGETPIWFDDDDGINDGFYGGDPINTVPGYEDYDYANFDTDIETAWDILGNIDENIRYGSDDILIAIIDSGCDMDHSELEDNIWVRPDDVPEYLLNFHWQGEYNIDSIDDHHGLDMYGDGSAMPVPDGNPDATGEPYVNTHGTLVAGIAAAKTNNDYEGVAGVAGGSKLLIIRKERYVITGPSSCVTSCAFGVEYAVDRGADIINMSWGHRQSDLPVIGEDAVDDLFGAINYAVSENDVMLFAATHNHDENSITWPASNPLVIAVGGAVPCGTRRDGFGAEPSCDGKPTSGSNWSLDPEIKVDFLAPTILTTTTFSYYHPYWSGTSCATPYAAGVAALIKSANQNLTGEQIRSIMWATATDIVEEAVTEDGGEWEGWPMEGWDMFSGYGLVNAGAALQWVIDNPDPDFTKLYNKNQNGDNIGGNLKLEDIFQDTEIIVASGDLVPVRYGDYYNVETLLLDHPDFSHINWEYIETEYRLRMQTFQLIDPEIEAIFEEQYPINIIAQADDVLIEDVSIMIRDPWYINNEGLQDNDFYYVTDNLAVDGYYYVFLEQGGFVPNLEQPYYSLYTPEFYSTPLYTYAFSEWTGNYVDISTPEDLETSLVFTNGDYLSDIAANYNACGNGDVNQDNEINVLDVTRIVFIILGEPPEPSEYELWAADVNCDGSVNVMDIQIIINYIIGDPPLPRNNNIAGSAQLFVLGNAELLRSDYQLMINIESDVPVGGLQFDISIDIEGYEFSNMELTAVSSELNLRFREIEDGSLVRVVIYPLESDDCIPEGVNNVLVLNFESDGLSKSNDNPKIILNDVIISNCFGVIIEKNFNFQICDS